MQGQAIVNQFGCCALPLTPHHHQTFVSQLLQDALLHPWVGCLFYQHGLWNTTPRHCSSTLI